LGTGTRCYFANGGNILGFSGIRNTELMKLKDGLQLNPEYLRNDHSRDLGVAVNAGGEAKRGNQTVDGLADAASPLT